MGGRGRGREVEGGGEVEKRGSESIVTKMRGQMRRSNFASA